MDKTVPSGAALLLAFIYEAETDKSPPGCYEVIFGNRQSALAKPLTTMTVAQVQAAQKTWMTKAWASRFGSRAASSAAGAPQFMHATLKGLWSELGLSGSQVFNGNLQDRLGYHLLKRRGYEAFVAGKITRTEFGKRIAQEWASLPVLAATRGADWNVSRGQSYYAGDGLNKSLVSAAAVEKVLDKVFAAAHAKAPDPQTPTRTVDPTPEPETPPAPTGTNKAVAGVGILGAIAAALYAAWEWLF